MTLHFSCSCYLSHNVATCSLDAYCCSCVLSQVVPTIPCRRTRSSDSGAPVQVQLGGAPSEHASQAMAGQVMQQLMMMLVSPSMSMHGQGVHTAPLALQSSASPLALQSGASPLALQSSASPLALLSSPSPVPLQSRAPPSPGQTPAWLPGMSEIPIGRSPALPAAVAASPPVYGLHAGLAPVSQDAEEGDEPEPTAAKPATVLSMQATLLNALAGKAQRGRPTGSCKKRPTSAKLGVGHGFARPKLSAQDGSPTYPLHQRGGVSFHICFQGQSPDESES